MLNMYDRMTIHKANVIVFAIKFSTVFFCSVVRTTYPTDMISAIVLLWHESTIE